MDSRFDRWSPKLSDAERNKRKAFGAEVQNIRLENNLSINEAAEMANVTPELFLRIELGSVSPDGIPSFKKRLLNGLQRERKLIIV
jgi:predicted transcriptional regulator